jgi:hypothetical protein
VRRASGSVVPPDEGLHLYAADTLVLSGLPQALGLAQDKILSPKHKI